MSELGKHYQCQCTHPMCDGLNAAGDICTHAAPHAYDETECHCINCGVLEEPSSCAVIFTEDGGTTYKFHKFL